MRERYTGIALPKVLTDQIDKVIASDKWGYKSRAELTKEAVRKLILELRSKE